MPSKSQKSSSATAFCNQSARVAREALTRPGCGVFIATCEPGEWVECEAGTSPPPRTLVTALPERARTLPSDSGSSCTGFRRRLPASGFTLLEVMVALAILGIGLGVIFQGLGQGLRLRGASAERVRLALVAESVLGGLPELAAAPERPEEGEEGGLRWRLEPLGRTTALGAVVDPGGGRGRRGGGLVEVRLTVTAPSGLSWELVTLLPRPAEAAP